MGTLLIVDDSPAVRREMSRILGEGCGFDRFLEAGDGAAGLRVLTDPASAVDVIACDVQMPVMDGLKFLRAVKGDPALALVPVVMVTAGSEVQDVVRAFEIGAGDFISKPFNAAILRSRFKNMLRIKQLQDELRRQKELMEGMASTDALTGIANRRALLTALEEECRRSVRYGNPLTVLVVDLDRFKRINDRLGHARGDEVLRETASLMVRTLRAIDLVARFGGEEFVVLLPQTAVEGGRLAAERLRREVEAHPFEGLAGPGQLTVSVGVATAAPGRPPEPQALLDEADRALYRAKRAGRNRIAEAAADEPPAAPGRRPRARSKGR